MAFIQKCQQKVVVQMNLARWEEPPGLGVKLLLGYLEHDMDKTFKLMTSNVGKEYG